MNKLESVQLLILLLHVLILEYDANWHLFRPSYHTDSSVTSLVYSLKKGKQNQRYRNNEERRNY